MRKVGSTYRVTVEEVKNDFEVVGRVRIDDLANIGLVLNKVCECVTFHD